MNKGKAFRFWRQGAFDAGSKHRMGPLGKLSLYLLIKKFADDGKEKER